MNDNLILVVSRHDGYARSAPCWPRRNDLPDMAVPARPELHGEQASRISSLVTLRLDNINLASAHFLSCNLSAQAFKQISNLSIAHERIFEFFGSESHDHDDSIMVGGDKTAYMQ